MERSARWLFGGEVCGDVLEEASAEAGWSLSLVLADVALFVLANVTAQNSSHPGTVSNVLFTAFVIGIVLLITLAIVAVVISRRAASR